MYGVFSLTILILLRWSRASCWTNGQQSFDSTLKSPSEMAYLNKNTKDILGQQKCLTSLENVGKDRLDLQLLSGWHTSYRSNVKYARSTSVTVISLAACPLQSHNHRASASPWFHFSGSNLSPVVISDKERGKKRDPSGMKKRKTLSCICMKLVILSTKWTSV